MDGLGSAVMWLLAGEAGLLLLAVLAYLSIVTLRGRDVSERVHQVEIDMDSFEERLGRAMKRLSPGRPPKPTEPEEEVSGPVPGSSVDPDRQARIDRIRQGMFLRRRAN